MITIRKFDQLMLQQRTDFFCYECGYWSAYFLKSSPDKCEKCKTKLPNLQNMLDAKEGRREYHFSKTEL